MKAVLLTELHKLELADVPEPRRQSADEVLLRIDAVGICGSDVHYYKTGRIGALVVEFPWVLGHECCGTVLEVGAEARGLKVGQRVAIDPLVVCGRCDQCLAGRKHTCRNQKFLGCPGQKAGSLCERMVMPAECCFPLPEGMTDEQAVLTEPLAIGVYASRLASAAPGGKVGGLGTGPVGLCTLLAVKAAGPCTAYATDLIDARLDVARRCGADWTGNPRGRDVVADILQAEPLGLDFVFECAGEQETYDQCLELLAPGGTLLAIGIPEANEIRFSMDRMRRKELRLQNVRRQNECVADAIAMVADGAIEVEPLATHHFPLEQTAAAFELVEGYCDGVVKAIVHVAH